MGSRDDFNPAVCARRSRQKNDYWSEHPFLARSMLSSQQASKRDCHTVRASSIAVSRERPVSGRRPANNTQCTAARQARTPFGRPNARAITARRTDASRNPSPVLAETSAKWQ